jgi:hypothetical protein
MGEVRQFDRELHLDILETIQKREDSTMQEGIRWFLDHKEHSLWRLLDPQIEAMPDQSLERPWDGGGAVSQKRRMDVETGAIVPFVASQSAGNGGCRTCGKRRSEHPNWRFCSEDHVPRWAQQRALAPPKAKPAGPGKGGKGKDKGRGKGKTPAWMVGHASRTPPSTGAPNGLIICWGFHNPAGPTCHDDSVCGKAHLCPVYLTTGLVCGKPHKVSEHTE